MLRIFVRGMLLGLGFSLSFIAVMFVAGYVSVYVSISPTANSESWLGGIMSDATSKVNKHVTQVGPPNKKRAFGSRTLSERVRRSSAVAVTRFARASDGAVRSVIERYCKKEPGVKVQYNVGESFPPPAVLPDPISRNGDGYIIFFTGSPSVVELAVTYANGYISPEMTLERFLQKCDRSP